MDNYIIFQKKCPCCNRDLKKRYKRKIWERFIPKSRKYLCMKCNKFFLRLSWSN